jgi:hypothetical protein
MNLGLVGGVNEFDCELVEFEVTAGSSIEKHVDTYKGVEMGRFQYVCTRQSMLSSFGTYLMD